MESILENLEKMKEEGKLDEKTKNNINAKIIML